MTMAWDSVLAMDSLEELVWDSVLAMGSLELVWDSVLVMGSLELVWDFPLPSTLNTLPHRSLSKHFANSPVSRTRWIQTCIC